MVERSRLVGRVEELTQSPLTVVAAPTGYGKTTLLASWAASTQRQVAWASVGSRDLDADGFWALLTAALEQIEPRLRFGLRSSRNAGDRAVQIAVALELLSRDLRSSQQAISGSTTTRPRPSWDALWGRA